MDDVSDLVMQQISELRTRLGDKIQDLDDKYILRFLIARDHDIAKAEEMLRNHVEWKERIEYDQAHTWIIDDVVQDSFQFCVDGKDKEGRLVVYCPVGAWHGRRMLEAGLGKELDRHLYHMAACMASALAKSNGDKLVGILDLAELSYYKIAHYDTVQLTLRMLREREQNFPETLEAVIIINSPWVLDVIFPLIKPILGRSTLQKLEIYNSSPHKWMPVLLDRIQGGKFPSMFLKKHKYNMCHGSKNSPLKFSLQNIYFATI
ncbi:SEC14-like protein 4 [Folsomia candida]|uniref:SEC14-like protein 4 n=1 Tax=Folsomia candida TaxID=158441 RepID=UPI0016055552|nr:SEC14-like protein 4 [Folsomia candida]